MGKYYSGSGRNLMDLKSALDDYYGASVTYYGTPSSSSLIFYIPAVCDKVVRFRTNSYHFFCEIGMWDGADFVTSLSIGGDYTGSASTASGYVMLMHDDSIFLENYAATTNTEKAFLICKTTGTKFIAACGLRVNHTTYGENIRSCFTDGTSIVLRGLTGGLTSPAGNLYKGALFIVDLATGRVVSESGQPLTINNYFFASKSAGSAMAIGPGYYLSRSGYYTNTGSSTLFSNSILIEGIV